jgi:hypothetical protein
MAILVNTYFKNPFKKSENNKKIVEGWKF